MSHCHKSYSEMLKSSFLSLNFSNRELMALKIARCKIKKKKEAEQMNTKVFL